jgi:hypothetical protein
LTHTGPLGGRSPLIPTAAHEHDKRKLAAVAQNTGNTSNTSYELVRVPLGAFAARPPTLSGFARLLFGGGQLKRYRPVI